MELAFDRKEKIAGVFVITVAILLLATVVILGRSKDWFKTYVTYYTIFDESYNLQENAAVKLYNADIGKVKKITLVENKVKVKLSILEQYASRIRKDSVAIVESPTFIGSEYIAIQSGIADILIEENGEIPSAAKKSVADILTEFQVEKTAKMVVEAVQNLSEIAQIIRDPNGPLFEAFENINKILSCSEKIASDVQAGKGSVGNVLKSKQLTDSIVRNFDKMETILASINKASIKTPETIDTVQKIGNEVFDNIAIIKKILNETTKSISILNTILSNMEKGSRDVPKVTQSTKQGVNEIRVGVESIDKVFQSLQKNILIRSNLPPELEGKNIDAGLRR